MNDYHLDDLIIGDPEPVSGNSKSLLTIIALLIIILIVGLILWALIFGSPDETATQPGTPTQPTSTHSLDPSLIPLDSYGNEQKKPIPPAPVKKPKPAATPAKPNPGQTVHKPANVRPAPAKPKPVTKSAPVKPKPSTPAAAPRTAAPHPKAQAPTPAKHDELIKNADKTIYYIQVGAFKRDPSPKFIQKLKENGFTFITKITNNMRRVRVGPYDSYDEAKAALPDIKAKLGIDGLIVKF